MPPKLIIDLSRGKEELVSRSSKAESNIVPYMARSESKMVESSVVREGEKLIGTKNYYIWSLKMRAILRGEGMWPLTKAEQNPTTFRASGSRKRPIPIEHKEFGRRPPIPRVPISQ